MFDLRQDVSKRYSTRSPRTAARLVDQLAQSFVAALRKRFLVESLVQPYQGGAGLTLAHEEHRTLFQGIYEFRQFRLSVRYGYGFFTD
jgi:hypothetical protein